MTDPDGDAGATITRSPFVTVVAWVFIVLSGFITLISALQNIMIRSMPWDQLSSGLQDSTFSKAIPGPARAMFAHMPLFVLLFFILSLTTLVASIGMLHRQNWARRVFIGMLCVNVAYVLGGIFIQRSMISSFNAPEGDASFESVIAIMRAAMLVVSLAIAGVCGWLAMKLHSPRIRGEFAQRPRAV